MFSVLLSKVYLINFLSKEVAYYLNHFKLWSNKQRWSFKEET